MADDTDTAPTPPGSATWLGLPPQQPRHTLQPPMLPMPSNQMPPLPNQGMAPWRRQAPWQLQNTNFLPVSTTLVGYESGGRNIREQVVPFGESTAQGYFQITNPTWREFAPQVGVNLSQYPDAMSAPPQIQQAVANQIPLRRWSTFDKVKRQYPWLTGDMTLGQANQSAGSAPPQRYIMAQPDRPHVEWGKPPTIPDGYSGGQSPGYMPRSTDLPQIMQRVQQMLPMMSGSSGISQLLMLAAFGGFMKARREGQYLEMQMQEGRFQLAREASVNNLEQELSEGQEAFAAYGGPNGDPQKLAESMTAIADKYGDNVLRSIAHDPARVEKVLQQRDATYQDLYKSGKGSDTAKEALELQIKQAELKKEQLAADAAAKAAPEKAATAETELETKKTELAIKKQELAGGGYSPEYFDVPKAGPAAGTTGTTGATGPGAPPERRAGGETGAAGPTGPAERPPEPPRPPSDQPPGDFSQYAPPAYVPRAGEPPLNAETQERAREWAYADGADHLTEFSGKENARAKQAIISRGLELRRSFDKIMGDASSGKLRGNDVVKAVSAFDPQMGEDLWRVIDNKWQRGGTGGGSGATTMPFMNRLFALAQNATAGTDHPWNPGNAENAKLFGSTNSQAQQSIGRMVTLAGTAAQTLEAASKVPQDQNALAASIDNWKQGLSGKGSAAYSNMMADLYRFYIEDQRIVTSAASVQEVEQQVKTASPTQILQGLGLSTPPSARWVRNAIREGVRSAKTRFVDNWQNVWNQQGYKSHGVPDPMPGYNQKSMDIVNAIEAYDPDNNVFPSDLKLPQELQFSGGMR